jgi:hypothetical protein
VRWAVRGCRPEARLRLLLLLLLLLRGRRLAGVGVRPAVEGLGRCLLLLWVGGLRDRRPCGAARAAEPIEGREAVAVPRHEAAAAAAAARCGRCHRLRRVRMCRRGGREADAKGARPQRRRGGGDSKIKIVVEKGAAAGPAPAAAEPRRRRRGHGRAATGRKRRRVLKRALERARRAPVLGRFVVKKLQHRQLVRAHGVALRGGASRAARRCLCRGGARGQAGGARQREAAKRARLAANANPSRPPFASASTLGSSCGDHSATVSCAAQMQPRYILEPPPISGGTARKVCLSRRCLGAQRRAAGGGRRAAGGGRRAAGRASTRAGVGGGRCRPRPTEPGARAAGQGTAAAAPPLALPPRGRTL